jgi:hypothetical protein
MTPHHNIVRAADRRRSPERAFAPRLEAPPIRHAEQARKALGLEPEALDPTGDA